MLVVGSLSRLVPFLGGLLFYLRKGSGFEASNQVVLLVIKFCCVESESVYRAIYSVCDLEVIFLLVGACANCVSLARGTALKSVRVVGLAIAASFYVSKTIIHVVWVATGKLTTAVRDDLADGFGTHATVATTGLMTSTVECTVETTPTGVVQNVPLSLSISQIIC